jgi:hypothetical protein
MNYCTKANEVWYSERSWTFLQLLFYILFSLRKHLHKVIEQNCEVNLGQTLNHSV